MPIKPSYLRAPMSAMTVSPIRRRLVDLFRLHLGLHALHLHEQEYSRFQLQNGDGLGAFFEPVDQEDKKTDEYRVARELLEVDRDVGVAVDLLAQFPATRRHR